MQKCPQVIFQRHGAETHTSRAFRNIPYYSSVMSWIILNTKPVSGFWGCWEIWQGRSYRLCCPYLSFSFRWHLHCISIYSAQSCRKLPHIQSIILRMQREIHHFPARARVNDVKQETRASDRTRALKCIQITATVTLCLFYGLFKGSFRLLHFRKTHRSDGFQCTSRFLRKHSFHVLNRWTHPLLHVFMVIILNITHFQP